MITTRTLTAASVGVVLLALSACSTAGPTATQRAPAGGQPAGGQAQSPGSQEKAPPPLTPPVKVNVGFVGSLSDGPMLIAYERGYWRDEGLDPELVPASSGPEQVPFVSTGKLDIGAVAGNTAFFNAWNRDVKIRLVADKSCSCPGGGFQAILIRKDLWDSGQVRDARNFKGLKIAMPNRQGTIEVVLWRELKKVGLSLDDVEVMGLPIPETRAALANKAVDVVFAFEPAVGPIVDQGLAVKWKTIDELSPGDQQGVLVISELFAERNREAANRFMVGYVRGLRDFLDAFNKGKDKAEIVPILTKHLSVKDPAMYDKMVMPGFNPDGYVNKESMKKDARDYVTIGWIKDMPDVDAAVDNSYVDYAIKRLGKYSR